MIMMDLTANMETLLRVTDAGILTALQHYGLSEAQLQDGLRDLRLWLSLQPHLPQGQMCDRKLVRHFAACGFSMERTKKNIDGYFSARNLTPEFTSNRDPLSKNIENVFESCVFATFPQQTDQQHRVTFLRLKSSDATNWQAVEAFKTAFMIGDYRLMNDSAVGDHFIIHFGNVRIAHLTQFTPAFVTKSLFYLQSCIGAKIKGIHLVGLPPYAEAIVNMFKKALSKKVAERFYMYSCFEELKDVFPAKIIPSDLGGEDISTETIMENWKQTLQSPAWRQWFIEQENVKTDESKRDRTTDNGWADELLGLHGSFRKLDVD